MSKLLLDENLSFRLVSSLQTPWPGSTQVDALGLRGAHDRQLWAVAGRDGFALVSKDDDFRQMSLLKGAPPKVIILALGNRGNDAVLRLLFGHQQTIDVFLANGEESVLILQPAD